MTPAEETLQYKPAGVFLSNGPGDPAVLDYAVKAVSDLVKSGVPIFGICLGHQILGQAFGGKTFKLKFGHRAATSPSKTWPRAGWRSRRKTTATRWMRRACRRKWKWTASI